MSPFWIALAMAGCFAVGLLFGILLHKITSPSRTKRRRLEGQIDQIRDEYVRYQAGVTQHFNESAALIKRLNQDYQAVITHLAHGAGKLSGDPELGGKDMLARLGSTESTSTKSSAPDDYAAPDRQASPPAAEQVRESSASHDFVADYRPAKPALTKPGAPGVTSLTQAPAESTDALQVPEATSSSIQGVKVAGKHVTTADYDQQHVDGYVQAPRDYAPRRGPEDNGTLAETYGFDRGGVKH